MARIFRECPCCRQYRDDVQRDYTGEREACGKCKKHETGPIRDRRHYRSSYRTAPQMGGRDCLRKFRDSLRRNGEDLSDMLDKH